MYLPIEDVHLPTDLACVRNGALGSTLLSDVGLGGRLHTLAARAWNTLWVAAQAAQIDLTWTWGGTYRTLEAQTALFLQRWVPASAGSSHSVFWSGGWWTLRPGVARAAIPGTSNHGFGIAVDLALGTSPNNARGISEALDWLAVEAPTCGWSWETIDEPWHLRYTEGDLIPSRVLDMEDWFRNLNQ